MRRMEAGGTLLFLVAIVAIATFAYIGFMLSRDPQKAETIAEGVEEATEGETGEVIEVTTVATNESKFIHDKYVELGYPDDDNLPESLTDAIVLAYEAGKLPVVDQLLASADEGSGHAAIVAAAMPGEVNPNVCGLYGQELCFLLYRDDTGTRVIAVFDAIRGSPREHAGTPILDQFVDETYLVVVNATGDGPELNEEGYVVDVTDPGSIVEIARMHLVLAAPRSAEIQSPDGVLTFTMEETGKKVAGEITITELRIAVTDSDSDLGVIEGAYNEDTETAVTVDYARSYDPSIFTGGTGDLYVWVLGALYRYDGTTLTEVSE